MFDIHAGVPRLRKALSRSHAKEGKRTVIVGDVDGMQAAIGRDEWAELVKEAKRYPFLPFDSLVLTLLKYFHVSYGLDIFPPSKVVQSVLEVKLDLLESTCSPMDESRFLIVAIIHMAWVEILQDCPPVLKLEQQCRLL